MYASVLTLYTIFVLVSAARANSTADPTTMARYRAGYNECVNEVSRYLMSLDGLDVQVRARLLSHLASYCTPCAPIMKPAPPTTEKLSIPQPQAITLPMASPLGSASFPLSAPSHSNSLDATPSVLNTTQFQIVPGQLANGKIAAVLVPSQNAPLAMVSSPQLIPLFNKSVSEFQAFQGLHVPDQQALRAENDPLWRPWWGIQELTSFLYCFVLTKKLIKISKTKVKLIAALEKTDNNL